jgi:ribosomal protein S20
LAHSQRGWTGARTPSAIKRVRQTARKRAINQPRRAAAKTLVAKAVVLATDAAANGGATEDVQLAVQRAVSALDRAAKSGVIHRNAADRRKSRLMLKVSAVLGGEGLTAPAKVARTTGKAAAAKQAKARIAASRATKAKGAQTAAGKARAALARTSRDTGAEKPAATAPAKVVTTKTAAKPKAAAKAAPAAKAAAKPKAAAAPKASPKSAAKPAAKAATAKTSKPAAKASAKPAAKGSAKKG